MIPPMRFFSIALPLLLVCLASSGCATRTETFEVSVRNESASPVIVWLTKLGGPEEEGWRTPESIAINFVVEDEQMGNVLVEPGETGETGKEKAKLDKDSRAVLRVYKGEMKMSEMLANGSDSPNRADTFLNPGMNQFTVTDADGKLTLTRTGQGQLPPARR